MYISYDIRGIQQSIFAVPRLRYIIGASSMIDEFDRDTLPRIAEKYKVEHIFSGGGRGLLAVGQATQCDAVVQEIVKGVNELGLDVRIGRSEELLQAVAHADELHPFTPENLDGDPCAVSGLWPVKNAGPKDTPDARLVHPMITRRADAAAQDRVGRNLLEDIKKILSARKLTSNGDQYPAQMAFVRTANSDDDDTPSDKASAKAARAAMGDCGRWAIVAMDGNDIGNQHRAAINKFGPDQSKHRSWLSFMSKQLDTITRQAVARGVADMIIQWWHSPGDRSRCRTDDGTTLLPLRPLLVGGDDVLLICRCDWAVNLARSISKHLSCLSRQQGESSVAPSELWLGTGGQLSISAGITFLSDNFPLAAGILYTEALLGSAKAAGRNKNKLVDKPNGAICSPSMLDWEHVTEGAIDNPTARRNRDLRFIDVDDSKRTITLTRRPWAMDQLPDLERTIKLVGDVPRSIRAEWKSKLRAGAWDRMEYLLRVGKNHPRIYTSLAYEPGQSCPPGWKEESPDRWSTAVLDAVELLEEGWSADFQPDKEYAQ